MLQLFQTLTKFIQNQEAPCFLLPSVVKHLNGHLVDGVQVTISDYEYYLKFQSGLSRQQQLEIRQKIMGRKAPKDFSQLLFPVAAGGQLPGSVVVTAHMSPDIDTTVSSFTGWMDAFEMDVAEGLHRWNVPNDPTAILEVKLLLLDFYGANVFSILSDNRTQLTCTALDLATCEGLKIYQRHDSTLDMDRYEPKHAGCVVDEHGNFCGSWLAEDVEKVRLVIDSLNHCCRWLQNAFFHLMVSKKMDLNHLLQKSIQDLEPVQEFSIKQKNSLDVLLKEILYVEAGLTASVSIFMQQIEATHKVGFNQFLEQLHLHKKGDITDLETLFELLSDAFKNLRRYVDTFNVALKVKEAVYHDSILSVHPHTTYEEIALKIQERSALFVTRAGRPEGVIYASRLLNPTQGFVVLRDFSNPNEIGIPKYMEIAAVLDHHKSDIKTQRVTTIYTMDVQSSNVIGAKLAFDINKKLSTNGPTDADLDQLIVAGAKNLHDPKTLRVLDRTIEEKIARSMQIGWCDQKREAHDYKMFLYAILDDTDLLAKKTAIDHEVVVELINRLESLETEQIVEVIDPSSTAPLIQQPQLYKFYKTVYAKKEEDVEERLHNLNIFADTKKQSKALVGQLKIYPNNVKTFQKLYNKVADAWHSFATDQPLKVMMLTTVEGAEDLFKGIKPVHDHQDELWVSCDPSDEGYAQLAYFLTTFFALHHKKKIEISAPEQLHNLMHQTLEPSRKIQQHEHPWIVFKFQAGTMTSRKKDISPCLKV